MAKTLVDRLEALITARDKARNELSRLEGRKESLQQRLKDEFGITSSREAKAEVDKLAEEIRALNAKISSDLDKLEMQYLFEREEDEDEDDFGDE